MTRYLAHIADDQREQTVLEHLIGTAKLAAAFAADFDGREQGWLVGMAHDIGKYSAAFQQRLLGAPHFVDHATAGGVECAKMRQICAAFAIMGHHGRLPDGGSQTDNDEQPTLHGRIRRAMNGNLEDYSPWQKEVTLPPTPPPPVNLRDSAEALFFTRMLYSCLKDADFLDTEAFMKGQTRHKSNASIADLAEKLDNFCKDWFPPKTPLNEKRCAILQRCREQGDLREPGLFTLTIPTGGGKTVSSLMFALHHAKAQGLNRIIYVVPYTSIIEQNADVFRKILGEENVLEHHAGVLYDTGTEATPQSIQLAQATENWDIPVVVTTAVRFFESLFSCRPSQCRKLHNLAKSVVIFDEAQMLPIPYLRPCVYAIAQLVAHYHVSAILCTATQPALEKIFREFLPNVEPVEICPEPVFQWSDFCRTRFQKAGVLSHEELSGKLMEQKQALCIVNSRKGAYTLWEQLEQEGAYHLSTLMYPAHRRAVLEEIRTKLKTGQICRTVSTSLIEAGVDVDFPAVFREESGLDSILQAAGRCNREGKRSPEESLVTIFRGQDSPPPIFSIPIHAGRRTLSQFDNPDSQEAVAYYFHELLDLKGKAAQDQKEILQLMQNSTIPFREIAERFHLIDNPTRTLYIPREDGIKLIDRLYQGERNRDLFRRLGQFGVSIYEQHFQALLAAGDIEVLDGEIAVLVNSELYHEKTGLSLKADYGKGLFI